MTKNSTDATDHFFVASSRRVHGENNSTEVTNEEGVECAAKNHADNGQPQVSEVSRRGVTIADTHHVGHGSEHGVCVAVNGVHPCGLQWSTTA